MDPAAADIPTQEELEELLQLIEAYERSGQPFAGVPQELQDMLKNVRRKQGVPTEDTQTLEIIPKPGCVGFGQKHTTAAARLSRYSCLPMQVCDQDNRGRRTQGLHQHVPQHTGSCRCWWVAAHVVSVCLTGDCALL